MRILVLGGYGAQGSVICTDLVKHSKVSEVICAGRRLERAKHFADRLKSEKLSTRCVNLSRVDELRKAVKDVDVVINTASYIYNLRTMKAAAESGASYQDLALGQSVEALNIPLQGALEMELELDKKFKSAGTVALINTGMDPGITDIIAGYAADKLDHVYEVRMKDCDVLNSKKSISTWAPNLLWEDMIAKSIVYKDGVFQVVPPFSGEEDYVFPDPVGLQPCYQHSHEEVVTMPRFLKDLRYVEFKMCGPDMPFAKAIYDCGIAGKEPIDVKGVKVAPLDVFLALTPPTPTMEEVERKIKDGTLIDETACLVVDIKGEKDGREVDYTFYTMLTLKEAEDRMPGTTATSYYTGIGAAVFTELFIEGNIKTKGVAPPEALTREERIALIQRLADKGITIHEISKKQLL